MKIIVVIGENDCEDISAASAAVRCNINCHKYDRAIKVIKSSGNEKLIIITSGASKFSPTSEVGDAIDSAKYIFKDVSKEAKYLAINSSCLQTVIGTVMDMATGLDSMEERRLLPTSGRSDTGEFSLVKELSTFDRVDEITFITTRETSVIILDRINVLRSKYEVLKQADLRFEVVFE